MIHDLKIWPEHFVAHLSGRKTMEIRLDDRGFSEGDTLLLREWDLFSRSYTGRELTREVSFVTRGGDAVRLQAGYVVLSLVPTEQVRLGALLHDLAGILGVKPIFGAIEEEPILTAARQMVVKAGEDARLDLVLELIRSAHTTVLMGSANLAWGNPVKAYLGEAERLLAALIDGRE